ncbi:MAG TPA: SpoIIE family protein phosphatase [Anaerolineales bacterium]|nr:SpoIIE family protein phosphatase [Anaerolineales bacterium]
MLPEIIRRVPLFATLPQVELDALASNLREYSYPAQTVLFEEGETGDRFYIVVEGEIAIIKAMGTGNKRLISIRGSGEFVGEMSLLNRDGLRTASAIVHTDSKTLEMSRAEFDELLHRRPTLAFEMLRVLSARLSEAHDKTIRDLMEKNRKLAEAYENLQAAQEQIIQKELMERELSHAHEIQQNMLPRKLPRLEGYDLGAVMIPARSVGGDLYDIIPLNEDKVGIVIGDVSGKGVPAALFMALTQSLIRAVAHADLSPDEVLNRVNRHLFEMNAGGMFVTVLYGVLCKKSREFTYVRAAHEYPLVWNQDRKLIRLPEDRGLPLGLFPSPVLQTQTLKMTSGCTMVLFTDGVTEARDEADNFFGMEQLEASVPDCVDNTAQGLCHFLVQKVTDFHGEAPQDDDITLVVVKTT